MRLFFSPRGDRSGSETAASLLAYAFGTMYGSALPDIKRTPNGKPYFPEAPHVHFSLSHSRVYILCAVSDHPVGADTESPRFISGGSIAYFCAPEELSAFDPLELWVLKESYIKLIGATLPAVKRVRFSHDGRRISAPDTNVMSKLYRISFSANAQTPCLSRLTAESYSDFHTGVSDNSCIAAVSAFGEEPPGSIEAVHLP